MKRKKNQTSNQTPKEEEARETTTHDLKRMIFLRRKWVDLQSSAFRIDINRYAAERCCQIRAWKTDFLPCFLPHLYQIEISSIKNMKSIENNHPHLFSDPPFLRRSSTRLPWPAFAAQRSALSPCCRCVAHTHHILKLNFCSLLFLETQLQMQLPESFLWLGILQKKIEERERDCIAVVMMWLTDLCCGVHKSSICNKKLCSGKPSSVTAPMQRCPVPHHSRWSGFFSLSAFICTHFLLRAIVVPFFLSPFHSHTLPEHSFWWCFWFLPSPSLSVS